MRKIFKAFIAAQFIIGSMAFVYTAANAEETFPSSTIRFGHPRVRTLKDMEAADAAMRTAGAVPEITEIPFRPTMNMDDYKAAKAAANAEAAKAEVNRPKVESQNGPLAPPTLKGPDIEGVNQTEAGGGYPPDTHGAVGPEHFVEITNSHLDIYRKSDGVRVKSVTLASFFGYTKKTLFDPRCVYDKSKSRWLITAEASEASATVQYQFIAASKTSDPTGAFYIYKTDVNTKNNDDSWDYPQLGVDDCSVIITANIFGPSTYRETRMIVLNKSKLYNGTGLKSKLYSGLNGTLASTIVMDNNKQTFMVAAGQSGNRITIYRVKYDSKCVPKRVTKSTVTVPAYSLPPNATQPGTSKTLDTSDSRFVNASTQIGNSLWQVHTINNGGRASPRWYEINTLTKSVVQGGFITTSATSKDWNASITANADKDVYVTWSSTDPTAGTNAQVRFSGRRSTDTANVIEGGSALFTSTTFYKGRRWGDYSAVTVDPTNPLRAWIVNEKINTSLIWGSRIGEIGF